MPLPPSPHLSREYGVDQFVRFNTAVTKLVYDDPSAKWEVHLRDVKSGKTWIELADVVINGQGFLNRPKFPKEISGIETFKGKLMHSARWDNTYDTVGKNVALIGTGSSGLQIAGAIGPYTKHFTIFQRTPSWLLPHFAPLVFKEGEREEFKKRDFFWEYYKRYVSDQARDSGCSLRDSHPRIRFLGHGRPPSVSGPSLPKAPACKNA